MDNEYLSPKTDIVFKKLFSDMKNEEIIKGFVSSVIDIPYESITHIGIENTEIMPEEIMEKMGRVDLNLTVNDKKVNVEMQVERHEAYVNRLLFYWSKLYTAGFKKGRDYAELKETVSVNILDFNMFEETEDYFSIFELYERNRGEKLTDMLKIEFFELRKLERMNNINDNKYLWMKFLNSRTKEEFDMLANTNVQINQAVTVLREISSDEQIRRLAEIQEKNEYEMTAFRRMAEKAEAKLKKAEAEKVKAEAKLEKAEAEKVKAEAKLIQAIKSVHSMGISAEVLSKQFNMELKEINKIIGNDKAADIEIDYEPEL